MEQKKANTKIFWTREEASQVIDAAATLIVETGCSELNAVKQANEMLPQTRQRKIKTMGVLDDSFRASIKQRVEEVRNKVAEPQEEPIEEAPVVQTLDDIVKQLAEMIGNAIGEALKAKLQDAIQQVLDAHVGNQRQQHPVEPRPQRPQKHKLLVIGLLPQQSEVLKAKFGNKLDLRFVSSQESPRMISGRVGDVERVLVMTKFISHAHTQAAMAAKGRTNVVLIDGGVTNLVSQLEKID